MEGLSLLFFIYKQTEINAVYDKKLVSKNLNNFEALYYGVPWPLTINVEHHQILQKRNMRL